MKKLIFLIVFVPLFSWGNFVTNLKNVECDEKGNCQEKSFSCTKQKPLKSTNYHDCFSCVWNSVEAIMPIYVQDKKACSVCSNRKAVVLQGKFICKLKRSPGKNYIETIQGYRTCNYCANESEIINCSNCPDDYKMVKGKCKRKEGRPCYQA